MLWVPSCKAESRSYTGLRMGAAQILDLAFVGRKWHSTSLSGTFYWIYSTFCPLFRVASGALPLLQIPGFWASQVAELVKNPPAIQETYIWSLGWKDPLDREMATLSSILAWRILWAEQPHGLQSMGLQRVGHDWMTKHQHTHQIQDELSHPPYRAEVTTRFTLFSITWGWCPRNSQTL